MGGEKWKAGMDVIIQNSPRRKIIESAEGEVAVSKFYIYESPRDRNLNLSLKKFDTPAILPLHQTRHPLDKYRSVVAAKEKNGVSAS